MYPYKSLIEYKDGKFVIIQENWEDFFFHVSMEGIAMSKLIAVC